MRAPWESSWRENLCRSPGRISAAPGAPSRPKLDVGCCPQRRFAAASQAAPTRTCPSVSTAVPILETDDIVEVGC